jgi:capsid protein
VDARLLNPPDYFFTTQKNKQKRKITMSLASKIHALVQNVAAEFSAIRRDLGNPQNLSTANKTSLVDAINELRALIQATPGLTVIDDSNVSATGTTFSAMGVMARLDQLKSDLLGGADAAFDTFREFQEQLTSDHSGFVALLQALDVRLRLDGEQALSEGAQAQGRRNLGAVASADIGDTDLDLVSLFREALASEVNLESSPPQPSSTEPLSTEPLSTEPSSTEPSLTEPLSTETPTVDSAMAA